MAAILESARLGRQDDEATPKLFFLVKLDKISQFLRGSRKTPISNLDPYNWGYPIRIKGIPCHDVASVLSSLKGPETVCMHYRLLKFNFSVFPVGSAIFAFFSCIDRSASFKINTKSRYFGFFGFRLLEKLILSIFYNRWHFLNFF